MVAKQTNNIAIFPDKRKSADSDSEVNFISSWIKIQKKTSQTKSGKKGEVMKI
jgi:hypothetical protein